MVPAYRIGKGALVVLLEEFLAGNDVEAWYAQLSDETKFAENGTPTLFDEFLEAQGKPALRKHLVQDVFGPGKDAALLPPGQLDDAKKKGIGRRLVYYRGIRRALELAYGFGGQVKADADRWTIDVYWGCGQPFNAVGLGTDATREVVTVMIYSDQAAMGDDGASVVPHDPTTLMEPDPAGDLFFVDDRGGLGTVNEWRATKVIGFATSPDSP